jgi:hypothetical protein
MAKGILQSDGTICRTDNCSKHDRTGGGVNVAVANGDVNSFLVEKDNLSTAPSTSSMSSFFASPIPEAETNSWIPLHVETPLNLGYDLETSDIYEINDDEYEDGGYSDGDVVHYNDEYYENDDARVGYIVASEHFGGTITRKGFNAFDRGGDGRTKRNLYDAELSFFNGNTGHYEYMKVPYQTGSAIKETPTITDIMTTLVSDAASYENNPTKSGYIDEMGYDVYDEDEMHAAEKTFYAVKGQSRELKNLVGEVMYQRLLWGTYTGK